MTEDRKKTYRRGTPFPQKAVYIKMTQDLASQGSNAALYEIKVQRERKVLK